MARMSNYAIRHFERPDESFPEYRRYFGYDDELADADDDEMDEIVGRYYADDDTVNFYHRMGELKCLQ